MVRAVTPIPFVKARFFDRCGKPLAGGKVYTYAANTTTPKVTYKDPYGLTPNTNPIILDAAGEADIYLDGTYRIRITDRNDVLVNDVEKIGSWFSDNLQDTLDNISGAMDDALKPILQNLDNAINAAAAAGAGANGWTTDLVAEYGLTQKQINAAQKTKNELWIDVTDKLSNDANNNVAALNKAISDAKAQKKGIRCAPCGTVNLNADVDFSGVRYVDFKADITTIGMVTIGGFSSLAQICNFEFAAITNNTSVISATPPPTPVFRIFGLKNSKLKIGSCNYLQIYADPASTTTDSTAYNDIELSGAISKFEIIDAGTKVDNLGGWINENRIWGGRLQRLKITGLAYVHNHNKFYNNTFEGNIVSIDYKNTWSNQIYGARFEAVYSAPGVSFDAESMQNSIQQTWSGSGSPRSQFEFSPSVVDNGQSNICYTEYSTLFTKTELFSVSGAMLVSDGVTTASQHYYFGRPKSILNSPPNFIPLLNGFNVTANRLIALSAMIPVSFGDAVKFDADYDGSLLRPLVWCYDANQKLITDASTGALIRLISGAFNNEFYSVDVNLPAQSLGYGFSVARNDVKYVQVGVYAGVDGIVRNVSAYLYTQNMLRAKSVASANTRIKVPQLANDVTRGFVPVGFEIYNSTFKNRNHVTFAFETRLSATANATDTTINIVSATGVKNGDLVGIQLDDDTTHWSKVSNLSGTTHTIDALPSIASQNARVVYNRWAVINYSVALNLATYASGVTTLTYTVSGATVGKKVTVNHSKSLGVLFVKSDVSATDTVTVTIYNPTGSGISVAGGSLYLSIE